MIRRKGGKIIFECDECGDILETDTTDFNEANSERRSAGWKALEVSGVWVHSCEECAD